MRHRSWIGSREAAVWQWLRPGQARTVLLRFYGSETGAEVLLRAYLSERDRDGKAARFWLRVYESSTEPQRTDRHR
jgi:hypothetical protein